MNKFERIRTAEIYNNIKLIINENIIYCSAILESRPVKIIEALLSSVYVKGEKDTPAPASTSGSG